MTQAVVERVNGHTEWRKWSELPWLARTGTSPDLQLCVRLAETIAPAEGLSHYLVQQLPEIASEFAAQWAAVLYRDPQWIPHGEFGRRPIEELPLRFLEEALDKDSGGFTSGAGWGLIASPTRQQSGRAELLVVCGRNLTAKSLDGAMAAAHTIGLAIDILKRQDSRQLRINRLKSILKITSQLGAAREAPPLLNIIAQEANRLLECDRSSIFIWDREHKEMLACPAMGVDTEIRIPDSAGIVGECLQSGAVIRVDDAYEDPRFNKQVDINTGYKTKNLLCVPIRDGNGNLMGVFEGINKLRGKFTSDDEDTLAEFGTQAAMALQNVRERDRLMRRQRELTEQVTQGVQIIGQSPAITALRTSVDRLASTDLPVLILGESGTGKEVVSQSLHYRGARHDQPFIAVNCAAIPETLLESELFGHEKGAFTDAREARRGKFELAAGGTLFLDEIGDMSPGGQAKLLRVLEQKVITRVGGSQDIRTNVRVIAATNANLAQKVREKKFREDLYYRLSVVVLELPPLRDRPEDILLLAVYFLERFSVQAGNRSMVLSIDARRRLQTHNWPGNVRELRNLMERVAFLCQRDTVEVEDLAFILSPDEPAPGGTHGSVEAGLTDATAQFQREYIRRVIKVAGGAMNRAADLLGLHRSNLYRKMRQLEMEEAGGEE